MSTLSIFVDESGDFGNSSEGYYVIGLVLHVQGDPLEPHLETLSRRLREVDFGDHTVHSGAAIRGEAEYRGMPVEARKAVFSRMHAFVRQAPILHHAVALRRRENSGRLQLEGNISRELGEFLHARSAYFRAFDEVIVYYDNGQAELTRILNAVMNAYFLKVEFRRMLPADYRLFQAADLICTLELLRAKEADSALTRSDLYFFGSARKLRKDYLKSLDTKRITAG